MHAEGDGGLGEPLSEAAVVRVAAVVLVAAVAVEAAVVLVAAVAVKAAVVLVAAVGAVDGGEDVSRRAILRIVRYVVAGLVSAALASACYSPSYRDCEVTCAGGGLCPDGFSCEEGVCRVAGATTACGGGDAGTDGSPGRLPIEQLFEAQFDTVCEYYVRCGSMEDVATCRALLQGAGARTGAQAASLIAAVQAGTVIYDEASALRCIAAFASLSCDRQDGLEAMSGNADCRDTLVGTVAGGGACSSSDVCVSRVCSLPANCDPRVMCCAGTCVGDQPPGEKQIQQSCTSADYCVGGYCETVPGNSICVPYKTQQQECSGSSQCGPGLYCAFNGGIGTCQTVTDTDGPCSTTDACKNIRDVCTSGVCREGGLTADPCDPTTGTSDGCQQLHFCTPNGCALPPAVGESCGANIAFCRGDAYCDGSVCQPRRADGAGCSAAEGEQVCSSGNCDTQMGRCASPPVCP